VTAKGEENMKYFQNFANHRKNMNTLLEMHKEDPRMVVQQGNLIKLQS
jgi:hypothetical protein